MAVRKPARKTTKTRRARATAATPAQARAHVFAPAHVKKIRMEEVDPDCEKNYRMPPRRKAARRGAGVDLGAMGLKIWTALKDSVVGYILHIRQNGTLVHVGVWNWAQTPSDAAKGWTEDTRMHCQRQQLPDRGGHRAPARLQDLWYDTKIINYLPAHWSKGLTSTRSRSATCSRTPLASSPVDWRPTTRR